jgi:hypothetical protein
MERWKKGPHRSPHGERASGDLKVFIRRPARRKGRSIQVMFRAEMVIR